MSVSQHGYALGPQPELIGVKPWHSGYRQTHGGGSRDLEADATKQAAPSPEADDVAACS